jgi:hypothetical protein
VISLLPSHSETIVTSLPPDEISSRVERATANTVYWNEEFKLTNNKPFYGFVHGHHFQIAARHMRLFSFNPLVFGSVEGTPSGSILFLRFRLFIMTRVMLVLWTVIIAIGGLVSSLRQHNAWYALGAVILIAFIHAVAWSNFKLQLKPTREGILQLLND